MAIIYTYPTKATPALEDLILISDMSAKKLTKNATIASLKETINVVDSFNSLTGDVTITGGTNITLNASGNNIEINSSGGSGSGTSGFETLPFTTANGYITATGTYVFQMIAPSNCAPANFKFYNLLAQTEENKVAVAIYKGDLDNGGSLQSTGQIAGVLSAAKISGSTLAVEDSATAISAGDDILVCLSFDSNISPLGVIPITASGEIALTNASPVNNEKLALFDSTSITASQFPNTIAGLLTTLSGANPTTSRPFLLIY
jgi:hypothetical protein